MNVPQMKELKRLARRRVADAGGLSLDHALDQLARENGFSIWAVLVRSVQSPLTPPPHHEQRSQP